MEKDKDVNEIIKNESNVINEKKGNSKNTIIIVLATTVLALFAIIGYLVLNLRGECDTSKKECDVSSQNIGSTNENEISNESESNNFNKLYLDKCLMSGGYPAYFAYDSSDLFTNKLMFIYYRGDDGNPLKEEVKTYVQDEKGNDLSVVLLNINSDGILFITDDYKIYEYSTSDFEKAVNNIGTVIKAKLKSTNIKKFSEMYEYVSIDDENLLNEEGSVWLYEGEALEINYNDGKTEKIDTWCSFNGTSLDLN